MKKAILIVAAILSFAVVASAQPRAIGVRAGYGAELSYQHSLGNNFAEIDLGWYTGGLSLTGIYDFVFASAGDLNFYGGPGVQAYLYSSQGYSYFNAAIAGQIGMEYNFASIPLQLSLDWRPAFYFLHGTAFGWQGFGLGIRYRF